MSNHIIEALQLIEINDIQTANNHQSEDVKIKIQENE